jgi:hypothetical protein
MGVKSVSAARGNKVNILNQIIRFFLLNMFKVSDQMKGTSVNDYDFLNFMRFVRDGHCEFLQMYVTSVCTCYCMR